MGVGGGGGAGDFCRQDRAAIKHSAAASKSFATFGDTRSNFAVLLQVGMLAQVWFFKKPKEFPMAS